MLYYTVECRIIINDSVKITMKTTKILLQMFLPIIGIGISFGNALNLSQYNTSPVLNWDFYDEASYDSSKGIRPYYSIDKSYQTAPSENFSWVNRPGSTGYDQSKESYGQIGYPKASEGQTSKYHTPYVQFAKEANPFSEGITIGFSIRNLVTTYADTTSGSNCYAGATLLHVGLDSANSNSLLLKTGKEGSLTLYYYNHQGITSGGNKETPFDPSKATSLFTIDNSGFEGTNWVDFNLEITHEGINAYLGGNLVGHYDTTSHDSTSFSIVELQLGKDWNQHVYPESHVTSADIGHLSLFQGAAVIPEPSSASLGLLAIGAFLWRRRRP